MNNGIADRRAPVVWTVCRIPRTPFLTVLHVLEPEFNGLLVIGAAFFIAGVFPPVQTPVIIGYLHGISGLGSPIAFTLIGRSLARSEPQLLLSHRLRWATLAAWGGLGLFLASVTVIRLTGQMDTPVPPWVSLANRFLIVTYCIWFIAAAWSAKCTPSFSS
jgi:hypothetical protein